MFKIPLITIFCFGGIGDEKGNKRDPWNSKDSHFLICISEEQFKRCYWKLIIYIIIQPVIYIKKTDSDLLLSPKRPIEEAIQMCTA